MVTLKAANHHDEKSELSNLLTVVRGKDVVTNLPKTIQVKSSEVTKETTHLANELLLQVREVCDLAPADLLSQALEQGIYFTGSGSLLRNLPEFLSQGMSTSPLFSKTPHLDVIKGLV
jgi:rod shape-determining protein MreB